LVTMDDPLDIEIRRQRSEWQTKATVAAEARQVANQREHEAELALASLRALERAAELRPSASQPPSSAIKLRLADNPTPAQAAGRKGRQFGAISKTWRGILEEMAILFPDGATDEQIAEIGRAGKLPNLRARDARRRNCSPPLGQNPATSPMPADSVAGERVGRHGAIEPPR
jgi:hypothetical protein